MLCESKCISICKLTGWRTNTVRESELPLSPTVQYFNLVILTISSNVASWPYFNMQGGPKWETWEHGHSRGKTSPCREKFQISSGSLHGHGKACNPRQRLSPRRITYFAFKEGRFMNKTPDFKIFFSVNFNFVNWFIFKWMDTDSNAH